jgi:hypothetical protein
MLRRTLVSGIILAMLSSPGAAQVVSKHDADIHKGSLETRVAAESVCMDRRDSGVVIKMQFRKLPDHRYEAMRFEGCGWRHVSDGLDFSRIGIYSHDTLVDVVAAVRIDPVFNKIRVFNGYDPKGSLVGTIEQWQRATGALVMINGGMYSAQPYYSPVAQVICDGIIKGPAKNSKVQGMLVAEPTEKGLPLADMFDFKYDSLSKASSYSQGIQHWPILLDRNGSIRVAQTDWQANRTVVGKDTDGKILLLTTEGGFFTLYNFGRFLKDYLPLKVHTAMNMDGGYEADMVVESPKLQYLTYGEFETYGAGQDATVFNARIKIPEVIGVFPR